MKILFNTSGTIQFTTNVGDSNQDGTADGCLGVLVRTALSLKLVFCCSIQSSFSRAELMNIREKNFSCQIHGIIGHLIKGEGSFDILYGQRL